MKRIIPFLALYILFLTACSKEETLPSESQLSTAEQAKTPLDAWFDNNFTTPYNIKIKYKWEEGDMSDFGRYNIPPVPDKVKLILELFQTVWMESYSEIGGTDFIKKISFREFIFRGGEDQTTNGGPGAWGQAAGGKTITIFDVNSVTPASLKTPSGLSGFSGLIHHEYTHILNQIKNFDEAAYRQITPEGYTANWQAITNSESNRVGFVSSYARMNIGEDFAEMVKFMLTRSRADWDAFINNIKDTPTSSTATKARADLRKKENLVVTYFSKVYGIDIYKLQAKTQQKSAEYINKP